MSFSIQSIADDALVIVVDSESLESFKELVQRGANLWPDASAEIKEFADMITNGEVLQNYRAQAKAARPAPKL